ncbi:MAG: GNAT family N-acetyltransferase [Caldisphaera sp.]
MIIRDLKWSDMNDLIDNYLSYYEELKENPDLGLVLYKSPPKYIDEVSWFSRLYSEVLKKDAIAFVAEENGKVVGMCDIHRLRPNSESSHIGNLGIAIRKEYRGKGIGKKLILKALEEGKNLFEIIQLEVFSNNKIAISLYEKVGFITYGIFPNRIKRKDKYYDVILMYYKYTENSNFKK